MKVINSSTTVSLPENVKVSVEARTVTVTGPRGSLSKDFKTISVEIIKTNARTLTLSLWFAGRKHLACLGTVSTHIKNMIKGVTVGFQYHMRMCHTHFPINVSVTADKQTVEIRNYLGERILRKVPLLEGCTAELLDPKEIVIRGTNVENVSQCAATIQQSTSVTNKDIRKFLDGMYVSERTIIKSK